MDADGDGEITKDEFVENAMKSRFMKKNVGKLDFQRSDLSRYQFDHRFTWISVRI